MKKWSLIIVAMVAASWLSVGCSGEKKEEAATGSMMENTMDAVGDAAAPVVEKAEESVETATGVVQEEAGEAMDAAGDLGQVEVDTAAEGMETVKEVDQEGLDAAKQTVMDSANQVMEENKGEAAETIPGH